MVQVTLSLFPMRFLMVRVECLEGPDQVLNGPDQVLNGSSVFLSGPGGFLTGPADGLEDPRRWYTDDGGTWIM